MLNLKILDETFVIIRLDKNDEIPKEVFNSNFYTISKTDDELSIICDRELIRYKGLTHEDDWKAFKVLGPLDFSLVGILSKLSKILADGEISIFAVSTYDTDYILVKNENLEKSINLLEKENYKISR